MLQFQLRKLVRKEDKVDRKTVQFRVSIYLVIYLWLFFGVIRGIICFFYLDFDDGIYVEEDVSYLYIVYCGIFGLGDGVYFYN